MARPGDPAAPSVLARTLELLLDVKRASTVLAALRPARQEGEQALPAEHPMHAPTACLPPATPGCLVNTVTAGRVDEVPGVENDDVHACQSGVSTPSGVSVVRDSIAAEASPNTEAVVVQGRDAAARRRSHREETGHCWHDRRTDLYQVEWRGQG